MVLELSRKDEIITVELDKDVKIECKPYKGENYSIAKMKTAKAMAGLRKQREEELEMGISNVPDLDDNEIFAGLYTHIFNVELAKQVIMEWEDVVLNGEPVEPTAENITRLFENGAMQDIFTTQYDKLRNEITAEKK